MHCEEAPLRTETIAPPQRRNIVVGWFPCTDARVSLWHKERHVKDVSNWTNIGAAIDGALRLTDHYAIEPGCGLVAAVTCTWSERVKVRDACGGWVWPPSISGLLPRPAIKKQRLVYVSDRGVLSYSNEKTPPVRLRFLYRYPVTGALAAEQDLTSLFSIKIEPLSDEAMIAGLSHRGMEISNLSVSNLGADPKVNGVFWAEASGEIDVFVDLVDLSPKGAGPNRASTDFYKNHLKVDCSPITTHTHFAGKATGDIKIYWEQALNSL